MRTERILISSKETDEVENQWWNENSATVEKIWAHSYALQQCIRYPYLKKAKAFLQNGNDKTTIWEVGCGTGWVCRLIADKNVNIIGTDFSKAQIDTAKQLALKFNKEPFCRYEVTDASTRVEGHNGIVISALLHHLTKKELEGFFKVIENQRKGTKVFMYEPVFIQASSKKGYVTALFFKKIIGIYKNIINLIIRISGQKNRKLVNEAQALFDQAEKNGWFLSPKEIPFYEDELRVYLDRYFTINNSYFVNGADFDLAQSLVFYNIENPGYLFKKIFLPISTWLDRIFFSLNFRSVSQGRYFFCCYELIVK